MKEAMRIVTAENEAKAAAESKVRVKKRMLHQAFTE